MIRTLLLFLLFFTTVFGKTYKEIQFNGLVHLSKLSASEIAGFTKEDDISLKDIDRSIGDFFKQGYFLDIQVREDNDVLIYDFKEKLLVSKITLIGVTETDKEEKYTPMLGIKKGDIFDESKLKRAKRNIVQSMRAEGYYSTVVEVGYEVVAGSVEVSLNISKGKRIIIYDSVFLGAKDFTKYELDDTLANKEKESFSWFFGQNDGKLDLLNFEYDPLRLKEFYMSKGYLDIKVEDPLLKADFNNFSAKLYYKLFEGKPYTITGIEIDVLDNKVPLDHKKEDLKLVVGKNFNVQKMRKDLEVLKDEVGSQGYAFARVYPDIQKDRKTNTAKIIYKVVCGEKVYIRDVIISGNDRTLDRVLRREVFLAPGELYNLVEIKESKKSLNRLGYFESVELKENRVSASEMDLIIKVKETTTGSLQAGGGWNSFDGFMVNASVSDRNIFGSSIGFSLKAESSAKSKNFSLSLNNPRWNDSDYSVGTSVYSKYYENDYVKTDTDGVSFSMGKQLNRYWSTSSSISYNESDNEYDETNETLKDLYISGFSNRISLSPSISYNNTDDFFVPRSGSTFSSYLDFSGFGGKQEYTKSVSSFRHYYGLESLLDIDIVFRYKGKVSLMDGDFDDTVKTPLSSRLYMGGTGSIRGFSRGSISPLDLSKYKANGETDEDDIVRVGGSQLFTNSLELSFPLIPSAKMRYLVFYDKG
ncbi:MAG: outer membrane protein assembly factor BamA, partial [Campylobacterales bacterium]|nr:outer membrane protein assembly factor BamA [Campylobacterales bacterium]